MSNHFAAVDKLVIKARKSHRCGWCPERIEAGTSYFKLAGYNEDFWHCKVHPECKKAWENFPADRRDELDDGYLPHSYKRGTTEYIG